MRNIIKFTTAISLVAFITAPSFAQETEDPSPDLLPLINENSGDISRLFGITNEQGISIDNLAEQLRNLDVPDVPVLPAVQLFHLEQNANGEGDVTATLIPGGGDVTKVSVDVTVNRSQGDPVPLLDGDGIPVLDGEGNPVLQDIEIDNNANVEVNIDANASELGSEGNSIANLAVNASNQFSSVDSLSVFQYCGGCNGLSRDLGTSSMGTLKQTATTTGKTTANLTLPNMANSMKNTVSNTAVGALNSINLTRSSVSTEHQ